MKISYLDRSTIDTCINKGKQALKDSYRLVNLEKGWHQFLGTKKIGIVASSIGLQTLSNFNDLENIDIENTLKFISKKQAEDNGWGYISNASDTSNIESTCWAILALNLQSEKYQEKIQKGIDWIYQQMNENPSNDEGWGIRKNEKSNVFLTMFALNTLHKFDHNSTNNERFQSAYNWLLNSQNRDGGWGATKENDSSIFHTAYVINGLIDIGFDIVNCKLKKAISFLKKELKNLTWDNISIIGSSEFFEIKPSERIRKHHQK